MREKKGFSLVELVIVIVILGVIAAIAIPRISSGSKNAGEAALRANLATMRNAIDWYYGEHNMTFPGAKTDGLNPAGSAEAFASQLTQYSNVDGAVSENKDPAYPYGPYVRGKIPTLSIGLNIGSNGITVGSQLSPLVAVTADGTGWVFSTATGEIIANSTQTSNDGSTFDDF